MNAGRSSSEQFHGEFGVLRDDGEKAQCHVCGEWFLHLGGHATHAHGLHADEYRRRFGLMRKTKLGGPAWLAMRRETAAEHLRTVDSPRRERVKRMSTEERRAEQADADRDRREHQLKKTPPERIRAPLRAKYGDEQGHPDAFIRHVAILFVEELRRGQRGVYKRLGERMGTDGSTARSRVMIAVRRCQLIWTGADREPAGHLPGEEPFDPPGSFDHMFRVLERRVEQVGDAALPDSEVLEGEPLGYWARRMKTLQRKGRLPPEREERLGALPGWRWVSDD